MSLGSIDDENRKAFRRIAGKSWEEDVTSRYKAKLLVEKVKKNKQNSYALRKILILDFYIASDSKESFSAWFEKEYKNKPIPTRPRH